MLDVWDLCHAWWNPSGTQIAALQNLFSNQTAALLKTTSLTMVMNDETCCPAVPKDIRLQARSESLTKCVRQGSRLLLFSGMEYDPCLFRSCRKETTRCNQHERHQYFRIACHTSRHLRFHDKLNLADQTTLHHN